MARAAAAAALIPAVAYYRMSSDKQEKSIADQRTAVQRLAAERGYRLLREYQDEGISGDATERRLGFKAMLADLRRGDFEAVLCWDQDRFGRFDQIDAGHYIKPMRDAGVKLVTVGQGVIDWTSFAGRLVYSVAQEGKHQFLVDLSRVLVTRMAERAQQGFFLGGQPPFGYRAVVVPGREGERKPPKRLQLGEPAQVRAIEWMFRAYAEQDMSLNQIVRELDKRGVEPPGVYRRGADGIVRREPKRLGGRAVWTQQTVRAILRNRVYLGEMRWNRIHHGGYHGLVAGGTLAWAQRPGGKRTGEKAAPRPHKRKAGATAHVIREHNAEADVIAVAAAHPAIIEADLFEAVQTKLVARRLRTTPYVGGGDFLLSGLLVCGHCGAKMIGESNASHKRPGRKWIKYTCGTYKHHGGGACSCNWVFEEGIVALLLREARKMILNPDNVALSRQRAQEERQRADASGSAERIELAGKVTKLEAEVARGADRLRQIPDALLPAFLEGLARCKQELDDAKGRLAALANPPEVVKAEATAQQEADLLWQLEQAAQTGERGDLRAFLQGLCDRVVLTFKEEEPRSRKPNAKWQIKRMRLDRGVAYLRNQKRLTMNGNSFPLCNAATPLLQGEPVMFTGADLAC